MSTRQRRVVPSPAQPDSSAPPPPFAGPAPTTADTPVSAPPVPTALPNPAPAYPYPLSAAPPAPTPPSLPAPYPFTPVPPVAPASPFFAGYPPPGYGGYVPGYVPPDAYRAPAKDAPGPTARLRQTVAPLVRLLRGGDPSTPSGLTGALAALLQPRPVPGASGALRLAGGRHWWPLYLLGLAVAFFLLYQAGQAVGAWASDQLTTAQYGAVRTTHLRALFGFAGESTTNPTTITAVNDAGTGHIFVLPGGQADKAFVLAQSLPADPAGRQPLHLDAFDADRDGYPDLLITLDDGTTVIYLLDTGKQSFRPPTADEQRRLILPGSAVR